MKLKRIAPHEQTYSWGAMAKRFLGMTPWNRTLLGCQAYAGVNLSTRSRYFEGLRNPQPYSAAFREAAKT